MATHQKVHIEEEVHIERAEVEEVGYQPPELPLADQRPAEKKLGPRGSVQLAKSLHVQQQGKHAGYEDQKR